MMETLNSPGAERDKKRIQSIELGFSIVDAVMAATEPMTLSAVARAVNMPPSKATLYLNSLCAAGLLARDDARRYRLGPYALRLGLAAMNSSDALAIARDEMPRLRSGNVLAVYLSVWGSQGPVVVAKSDQHPMLPMTIRLGHVLPLLTSATGRVFLANLPQQLTAPVLQREEPANPPDAATLDRIRKTGLASARGHVNSGVIATAAPLFDRDLSLAAVLTLLTPASGAKARDPYAEARLLETVRGIGAQLGR